MMVKIFTLTVKKRGVNSGDSYFYYNLYFSNSPKRKWGFATRVMTSKRCVP